MINKISTIDDVKKFARQLTAEGLSFHPDDDFNDYVNLQTNDPTYSAEDAEIRNNLMNDCFEVCDKEGVDVYTIMLEELLLESGLDEIIPLPSKE